MSDQPSPPSADLAISTRHLRKEYKSRGGNGGRFVAVADLTLDVPRGQIFGFLGPNGAGKTTAVKTLLGLTHCSSGSAYVLGAPLGDRPARRKIGYLPELFRYEDWLTPREILGAHCALLGITAQEVRTEVSRVLKVTGLRERAADRVSTFSKGMQQRLGLAVALLGNPQLLFLDEPTSALDPVGRRDFRDIIRWAKDSGSAVFLNSHLLSEVELLCDRVAIVKRGGIVAAGTIDELLGASGVRLRLENATDPGPRAVLNEWRATAQGETWTISAVDRTSIPQLVRDLVAAGAEITCVEPMRETLEERFMALVEHA